MSIHPESFSFLRNFTALAALLTLAACSPKPSAPTPEPSTPVATPATPAPVATPTPAPATPPPATPPPAATPTRAQTQRPPPIPNGPIDLNEPPPRSQGGRNTQQHFQDSGQPQ